MNHLRTTSVFVNYLSSYWILLLYGFALFVFLETGRNDFTEVNLCNSCRAHRFLGEIIMACDSLLATGLLLNLTVVSLSFWKKGKIAFHGSVFVFCLVVLFRIYVHFYDPLGIVDWFLD